jgi:hypothetical protein
MASGPLSRAISRRPEAVERIGDRVPATTAQMLLLAVLPDPVDARLKLRVRDLPGIKLLDGACGPLGPHVAATIAVGSIVDLLSAGARYRPPNRLLRSRGVRGRRAYEKSRDDRGRNRAGERREFHGALPEKS